MKGDLSKLDYRPSENFTGVLQQQGRVLTDQDWNAGTDIQRHLRELLGRDTIGAGTVAIPAEARDSLQALSATTDGNTVTVSLEPGRGWVDGLHLYLDGDAPVDLLAEYLPPPVNEPAAVPGDIAAGTRDAVILEVWEEAFSAYQARRPQRNGRDEWLLEPALGGPDTIGRVRLNHDLRLLRLADDEDCGNLGERLRADLDNLGHLTVTPAPSLVIGGDCPVQAGGGYSGFEHYLYRVEIAAPDGNGDARFKWSRFNGGLVGRGTYDNANDQITVRANDQMINQSGLTEFYLEVIAFDATRGHWRRRLSADATLIADGRLQLANIDGAWPGAGGDEAFFRLWDGIRLISDFPTGLAQTNELEQGIQLAFDPPAADNRNYREGDYWSFEAREAGTDFDPANWPEDAAPQGIIQHCAPLAILNWDASPPAAIQAPDEIDDCRVVFQPLTRQRKCCRVTVGDGVQSHGDFDTIQAAIDHLPSGGGEVCVLPGTYEENISIDRDDVIVRGCGTRSELIADDAEPAILIRDHSRIRVESMSIRAHNEHAGILVESTDPQAPCVNLAFEKLVIRALQDSAIRIMDAEDVLIRECALRMLRGPSPWPGLYLLVDGALVEHNLIVTATGQESGRGGVQLAGTSENVALIDNRIRGGYGNGITLGSLVEIDAGGNETPTPGTVIDNEDPCNPCQPGDGSIPPDPGGDGRTRYESAGALTNTRIERNRISRMGLNGIGVVGFFDLRGQDELIEVKDLAILGNHIEECLQRPLAPTPVEMQDHMGYGGVSLAAVERLELHDNVIVDNGPTHRYAVCGVFILHAMGADLSRNRIVNNGAKTPDEAVEAEAGRRAGICVVYAIPDLVPLQVFGELRPRQDGSPALRVHDNIVSQPLGQALYVNALGPVTVQGNQFTSRGMITDPSNPSFWATTVWILNMGFSNELYLQGLLFNGATADPGAAGASEFSGAAGADSLRINRKAQPGLDDAGIGQLMANGNVMLTNNQIVTDLLERDVSFAISSTLVLTLDDLELSDNHFDCSFLIDLLFSNLIAIGMTTRIQGNRFKETVIWTFFSSVALGLFFNNCSNNQATHCILNIHSPLEAFLPNMNNVVEPGNQILFDAFFNNGPNEGFCRRYDQWAHIFSKG